MNKKEFKELDREQMIIAFNQLKDDYSSLFDELEQEKEKNIKLVKEIEALELIHNTYKEMIEENNYIDKDKIRAKIEFLKKPREITLIDEKGNSKKVMYEETYNDTIKILEKMLEE